tara:strand:- start:176 stop:862 length:687 start_codon:yes stop_codon:yes gene_type:complete
MATILQLGTGQLDINTVADKLNTASNLYALQLRQGGTNSAFPVIFPDEFHSFDYLRFSGTTPFTSTSAAQTVATNISCYGTPVFSSNVGWITFPSAPYPETNGFLSVNATVSKNLGAERVGTITVTVTQPIGTYVISTTLTQETEPEPFTIISLGYTTAGGDPQACEDFVFSPATYYINPEAGGVFSAATAVSKSTAGGSAAAGWYSDGSVARYWNSASFTATQTCTI